MPTPTEPRGRPCRSTARRPGNRAAPPANAVLARVLHVLERLVELLLVEPRRLHDLGRIAQSPPSADGFAKIARYIILKSETLNQAVPLRPPAGLRKPSAGPTRRIPAAVPAHTSPKRRAPPAYLS